MKRLVAWWRSLDTFQTIFILTVVPVTILALVLVFRDAREKQRKREESLSYVKQVDALNDVQESLKNLVEFVDRERQRLQESEDIVSSLRAEQEKLKPVVETDRQVIDAILDLQYQKSRSDVWKERGIGFATGIVTSIMASFIYGFLRRPRKTANDSATSD